MKQECLAILCSAKPTNKKQSAQLTGSNSIVGNNYLLKIDSHNQKVLIKNKFDFDVAELNKEDAKKIILWNNKSYNLVCLLTYVTFCEPKSQYCGYFLIAAYPNKNTEAYINFFENVSTQISNGNIPDIKLDKFEQNKIIETNGNFKIKKFLPKPKLEPGTVTIKSKQTLTEKIIEAGRQKKPGCYIASIAFILLLLVLTVLLFKSCLVGS